MNTIRNTAGLVMIAVALSAQTPTQLDVSKVKGAAQLGVDGKVIASQLPASQGGGGASQTAQLLDWQFTRVSATQLSFGTSCLPPSPCNVDIGGTVTQFSGGPYLINLSGSNVNGSICVYISPSSQLTVGFGNGLASGNVTGSNGLALVSGVNACPQDASKLARWDVAGSAFVNAGLQYASYLSYKPSPAAGTGIQVAPGSRDTIQIDTGSVLRKFNCAGGPGAMLPAGATQGDVCWDFNAGTPAKYVCVNAAGCTTVADWKGY